MHYNNILTLHQKLKICIDKMEIKKFYFKLIHNILNMSIFTL